MPKCAETLDDLLAAYIRDGKLTELAAKARLRPWTLLRLRQGAGVRTHAGTLMALAKALRLPEARVLAAIEASRASR